MIRFSQGVFLTFVTQTMCLLLTLGGNVIITRTIGPAGKGVLALITNFFLLLVTVFTFGLSEGAVYLLGSRKYKHKEVFSSIVYAAIFTSILVLLASNGLRSWVVNSFLKDVGEQHYLTALWIFPAFYLFLCLRKILLGHGNIWGFNIMFLVQTLLLFLLYIFFLPSIGIRGGILSLIISLAVVDLVTLIFTSIYYGRPASLPNLTFLKHGFIFGMKSQIGIVLTFFDRRLAIFIINIFLNPVYVGFYAIAVALAELPWRISDAVGTVLFPKVAGIRKEEAFTFVAQACRNTIFIAILSSLILFVFAGFIIQLLFGTEFLQSLAAMQILLPGIVALSMNRVLCGGFSGLGKPEYGTYTVVCSSICTILLDIILIPRMGIVGAAVAASVAYFVSATVGVILFRRISKCSLSQLLIVSRNDLPRYLDIIRMLTNRRLK